MNGTLLRGGRFLLGPSGAPILSVVPEAPNALDAGVRVTVSDGEVYVAVPDDIDPSYRRALIVWRRGITGQRPPAVWVPAAPGLYHVGSVDVAMGRFANQPGVTYEVALEDANGLGTPSTPRTPATGEPSLPEGQSITFLALGALPESFTALATSPVSDEPAT